MFYKKESGGDLEKFFVHGFETETGMVSVSPYDEGEISLVAKASIVQKHLLYLYKARPSGSAECGY